MSTDSPGDGRRRPSPALPTPVSAALGLAAVYVQGVRRLPVTAVKVPVHAVGYALAVTDNLRREYEELAERGEALLARLRGRGLAGADQAGRAVTQLVDSGRDALVETGREAADGVRTGAQVGLRATATGVDAVADRVEDAASQIAGGPDGAATADGSEDAPAETPEAPAAEAPKGEATPQQPTGRPRRHDSAAETAVRQEVEAVTEAIGGRVPAKDELPIPNFDHLTLAQVRGRLRSLTVEELVLLRNYERAHADRLPIITMLDNRISKVADDATPGGSSAVAPGATRTDEIGAPAAGAVAAGAANGGTGAAGESTGWPGAPAEGAAPASAAATATGWPDTSGPGSTGGDGLASGGSTVQATTEAAPTTPAGRDAAGDAR